MKRWGILLAVAMVVTLVVADSASAFGRRGGLFNHRGGGWNNCYTAVDTCCDPCGGWSSGWCGHHRGGWRSNCCDTGWNCGWSCGCCVSGWSSACTSGACGGAVVSGGGSCCGTGEVLHSAAYPDQGPAMQGPTPIQEAPPATYESSPGAQQAPPAPPAPTAEAQPETQAPPAQPPAPAQTETPPAPPAPGQL